MYHNIFNNWLLITKEVFVKQKMFWLLSAVLSITLLWMTGGNPMCSIVIIAPLLILAVDDIGPTLTYLIVKFLRVCRNKQNPLCLYGTIKQIITVSLSSNLLSSYLSMDFAACNTNVIKKELEPYCTMHNRKGLMV